MLHKTMYSDYKSHTIVKAHVGIVQGGGFTFILSVFPGSISNKDLTVKYWLLNRELWGPGEGLMAAWWITIEGYLPPLGVKLVTSAFLKGHKQFTEEEVTKRQQIASGCIQIERMIQQLKCFRASERLILL